MLFRFHRGSLEASMLTVVEVGSMQELRDIIRFEYTPYELIGGLKFEHVCFDKRIGWNTYNVLGEIEPGITGVIGQTNGNEFV